MSLNTFWNLLLFYNSVCSSQYNQQLMEQTEAQRMVVFVYLCSEEELQLLRVLNVFKVFSNLPVVLQKKGLVLLWFILSLTWHRQGHVCRQPFSSETAKSASLLVNGSLWEQGWSDRNQRSSPSLSLPNIVDCWGQAINYEISKEGLSLMSFINISQCPRMWCMHSRVIGREAELRNFANSKHNLQLCGTIFEAWAHEQAGSFMLWFSDLAGSLLSEI